MATVECGRPAFELLVHLAQRAVRREVVGVDGKGLAQVFDRLLGTGERSNPELGASPQQAGPLAAAAVNGQAESQQLFQRFGAAVLLGQLERPRQCSGV